MKVFVIGGTGAIGRHSVRALVRAGHMVTALARTPEKAALLSKQGAKPVTLSIFDRLALVKAFEGHDAVINLATSIPPTKKFMQKKAWVNNNRIRTEGSAIIVDAAIATGVSHVVQESVSMLYSDRGDTWIDEDCATDNYPMAHGNHAAEFNLNQFSKAGGVGVILRFGWFYGPGATHSEEFLALANYRICIMMGKPDTYVSSIHVEDAGNAVSASLNVPAGIYNIVDDDPLTKRDYADALATAIGKPAWLYAPGQLAHLLGDRSTSFTRSLRVSNTRFRSASNWSPIYPSAREGWLAMAKASEQYQRRK